jgi:hypothetical protein
MKKTLITLSIITCLLISCSKESPVESVKQQKSRVYIQVEAVYNDGTLDLSPVVSISL